MESRYLGRVILAILSAQGWFYFWMPARAQLILASLLGLILQGIELRSRVVRQNLEIAFSGRTEIQKDLFKKSYRHLGHLFFEICMLLGPMPKFARKRAELIGREHWLEAKKSGRGVIMLANHVGNWEVMAACGALVGGMDVLFVTKRLKPEWLHFAIERARLRCQIVGTYEPKTLKDILRHLGKQGTVGIVLDQYAGPPIGVRVPVFGVPVGTSTAIATLAKRTGAAVIPVVNYRRPDGSFVVELGSPLVWQEHEDPKIELALNTANYAKAVEERILQHPEQWLWIHRRFKGDLEPLRDREWEEGRSRA
jgi:KDO2-lipid IV(A) lauroyltransferase